MWAIGLAGGVDLPPCKRMVRALVALDFARGGGASGVLRIQEAERPVPGDDGLLVRVCAITVNRLGCQAATKVVL